MQFPPVKFDALVTNTETFWFDEVTVIENMDQSERDLKSQCIY